MHLVAKVASLLRNELARLRQLYDVENSFANSAIRGAAADTKPRPEETYLAFDLFHVAARLATTFGGLKCFGIIETLCNDYFEQLSIHPDLRPLTLTAVSSVKDENSRQTDEHDD